MAKNRLKNKFAQVKKKLQYCNVLIYSLNPHIMNNYPITYTVTVYKTDFSGRSTGEISHTYCKTVNNSDEQQKFYESFDGGDYTKVTSDAYRVSLTEK